MEWVRRLYGATVGLDTAPLIYFVEEHPAYLPLVDSFFEAMGRGDIEVVTSTLTLTEVLVRPCMRGDWNLVAQYSDMVLRTRHLSAIPVSSEIAAEAARIRAAHRTATPDSIQLATTRIAGATCFVSNDDELPEIPGMTLIVLKRLLASK
jgi:predicted nucleic acid-binding protein